MMRYGNFSELIKDKYDNVIFEALSDFVSENPHLIESECDEIETRTRRNWTVMILNEFPYLIQETMD